MTTKAFGAVNGGGNSFLPGTKGRLGRGSTVVIQNQQNQASVEQASTSQQGATDAPKQAS